MKKVFSLPQVSNVQWIIPDTKSAAGMASSTAMSEVHVQISGIMLKRAIWATIKPTASATHTISMMRSGNSESPLGRRGNVTFSGSLKTGGMPSISCFIV